MTGYLFKGNDLYGWKFAYSCMFSNTVNLRSTCISVITDLRMPFHLGFALRFVLARMAIRDSPKTEMEKLTHAVKFKRGTLKLTWKQK